MKTLLAYVTDVPETTGLLVKGPNGEDIALFKTNGKIYALDNRCPHMEGPLCEGPVEHGMVTCPWHGWQFEISSGSCINMPGADAVCIPILIEGNQIFFDG